MKAPWIPMPALPGYAFESLRRRAIFECCKWDAQVEDVCTIADRPLVIPEAAWREVATAAEALAAETVAAEAELMARPGLLKELGMPPAILRALRGAPRGGNPGDVRLIRFDFHFTGDGWRISEANCDVPGGFNEASGLARLFGEAYPSLIPTGDPAVSLARAIAARCPPGGAVGLVHATAYSDDRQVMEFLGARLRALGLRTYPTGPDHVVWEDGPARRARLRSDSLDQPLDFLLRFFPAEWLAGLRSRTGWRNFFASGTPSCNPGSALLCQSKRFPLLWDRLDTPLPTWRALLPETRHPARAAWKSDPDWIVKPAWGRVGQGIGMHGFTSAADWKRIRRSVFWNRREWVAQRRFRAPDPGAGDTGIPCLGVYTVDGRVSGAYGRLSGRSIIDHLAQDTAVFLPGRRRSPEPVPERRP